MRVTKTIKDYIIKQVEAKLPMPTDTEYKQLCKALNAAEEEANDKIKAYTKQLNLEIRAKLGIPDDWYNRNDNGYDIDIRGFNSDMERAQRKMESEIKEKRENAIENIIVELELGGDRAKLEELLGAL